VKLPPREFGTIAGMALRIYGVPKSRTFRALWVAEELGIPYENVPVDSKEGAKRPEYLAVNPVGKIPAIDDDGFRLSESLAITTYLARRHGGPLQPGSPQDEARAMQWALWGATEIEQPAVDLVNNRHVLPAERRDAALAQSSQAKLERPLGMLEAQLAQAPYLLGERFTVADLNVSSLLYTAWFNKVDFSRWPRIGDWLERCLTRPAALAARKMRE
jgi:glutathione S-transferase